MFSYKIIIIFLNQQVIVSWWSWERDFITYIFLNIEVLNWVDMPKHHTVNNPKFSQSHQLNSWYWHTNVGVFHKLKYAQPKTYL